MTRCRELIFFIKMYKILFSRFRLNNPDFDFQKIAFSIQDCLGIGLLSSLAGPCIQFSIVRFYLAISYCYPSIAIKF